MAIRLAWLLVSVVMCTPCVWSANYYFRGEVTESTGGFVALTPPGTEVWSLIEFSDSAVQAGEAGASDLEALDIRYGGFCFPLGASNCDGFGAIVPYFAEDITSVQFDESGNIEGGALVGYAYSPIFSVSPAIVIDFDVHTISVEASGLGMTIAAGEVFAIELIDSDEDGLLDALDNCTTVANADQLDTNSDGVGNACDPDVDNNCVVNFLDLYLVASNFGLSATDTDFTGDGVVDFLDITVVRSYFGSAPGPSGNGVCP